MKTTLLLVALTVATAQGKEDQRTVAEEDLREKLFAHYDREMMPGASVNVTLKKLSFRYIQMYEEKHHLDVHSWFGLEWVDQRLAWEPGKFHNISKLSIPTDAVWSPDLTTYNGGNPEHQLIAPSSQYRIVLVSSARLIYIPSLVLRFSCVMDFTYWPYDEHNCTFRFGSGVYGGRKLDLRVAFEPEVDLSHKKGSSGYDLSRTEWSVVSSSATRHLYDHDHDHDHDHDDPCCSDPFVEVLVSLRLRRNAPAYAWLVQTPIVCLTLVSVVVFLLPTKLAGVKVILGGLLMVFDLLFLTFASDTVAHNPSHTPLLVKMVVVELVLVVVSVVVSGGVVAWLAHFPHSHPLPPLLRRPTLILAHLLFLQTYARQAAGLGLTLKPDEVALNDDEDMSDVGKGKRGESASQWRLLTAVVDRLALALYLVLTFFILISFSCVL